MELDEWTHKSCTAHFAELEDSVTLYDIESKEPGKGHAFELMKKASEYYKGKKMCGSVALNKAMKHLYQKLNYTEYV